MKWNLQKMPKIDKGIDFFIHLYFLRAIKSISDHPFISIMKRCDIINVFPVEYYMIYIDYYIRKFYLNYVKLFI